MSMQDSGLDFDALRLRMLGIRAQLDGDWSGQVDGQRHLDRDTPECAYWHAGYHQALADILARGSNTVTISGIEDTSTRCLAVG
jgi:hypothetical protein